MDVSKLNVKQSVLDAVDYVGQFLLERYPGLDFTIVQKDEPTSVWFLIHDKEVFQTHDFQQCVFEDILRDYLWPRKILNIIFVYDIKRC